MIAAATALRAIANGWDSGRLGGGRGAGLPREAEVIGHLGVSQGLATERVAQATAALDDVMAKARTLDAEIAALKPLDELLEDFALSSLARMILTLTAAAQMWGDVAALYTIATDDPRREIVDVHLLKQLLGTQVSAHDLAWELAPSRPLRRFGLIRTSTDVVGPLTGLQVHPLVLARLRAEPLDEAPESGIDVLDGTTPIDALHLGSGVADTLRAELARSPAQPLRLVIRGRDGSGRRTLLAALAKLADHKLARVRLELLGDRIAGLRDALERCLLAGWIPCIDGAVGDEDQANAARLRHIVAEFPGPASSGARSSFTGFGDVEIVQRADMRLY